jgi:alkanesulfonate monooxygenase SsuD/methylene tetrahydromethanopterin reductase-like flavin-dependent oxidoreductase (luciferase family)
MNAAEAITKIAAAEAAEVRQIWMNQEYLDTLTIFAAAAAKTSAVRLGTAIVQTYPRHPLALAQQVLVLNDIAPGRLRLGIGPSHHPIIEEYFGNHCRKLFNGKTFNRNIDMAYSITLQTIIIAIITLTLPLLSLLNILL